MNYTIRVPLTAAGRATRLSERWRDMSYPFGCLSLALADLVYAREGLEEFEGA